MQRVLVAGATGYLGSELVKSLHERGYKVRALIRKEQQKAGLEEWVEEFVLAQATQPETLKGIAEDVDAVFSSLGITRQKDGLSYEDVDYQANLNILREAEKSGVESFLYVSVLRGEELRDEVRLIEAKERFVDALKASSIRHCIIRPTGFFSDMKDFLEMAKGGRAYLLGDGKSRFNPIHGHDLAEACIELWEKGEEEADVGGPENFSHTELAQAAFTAMNRQAKISYFPLWLIPVTLWLMRLLTSPATWGPVEFFLTAMTKGDMLAPAYGEHRLEEFFAQEIQAEQSGRVA
jgi:uncharacterized protein YbjT (DUF2867 family)